MFYSQWLVSKKEPLGAIWVAAYFFRRLKKNQVKETDIPSSVDEILTKELESSAYRVLAYLLLGIVRIYSKKVDYLFDDCNKTLICLKEFVTKEKNNQAEKGIVLLPNPTPCFGIVLPERFELDAFDLEIIDDFHGDNVKPQEAITLKESVSHSRRTDQHSMERFDSEDYPLAISYEAYSSGHTNAEDERSDAVVDRDLENGERSREVDAIREILCMIDEEMCNDSSEDHLNAARGIDTCAEISKSTQEENTVDETPFLVEEETLNHNESSGDLPNQVRDMDTDVENFTNTPIEYAVREIGCVEEDTLDHDYTLTDAESLTRLEKGRSVRKRLCMDETEPFRDHVEDSGKDMEDEESDAMMVEASCEKIRKDSYKEDECMSPEAIHGIENRQDNGDEERRNFEVDESIQKETHTRYESLSSEEIDSLPVAKDTRGLATPETPALLDIPEEGGTSPNFSIIPTPAAREGRRVSRKRKCAIDDTVVISNKLMKQSIEDSSALVTKRRKVPRNLCGVWIATRLTNPLQCFSDPLIPYRSLDLGVLFMESVEVRRQETATSPEAAQVSGQMKASDQMGSTGDDVHPELEVIVPITEEHHSEVAGTAEQTEIAPDTPVRESALIRISKSPKSPNDKETRPGNSFAGFDDDEPTMIREERDLNMILMHDEVCVHEKGEAPVSRDDLHDSFSARTRKVAMFLRKTYLSQREREEGETLSLLGLCKGRTRKESARLFYETLVLKTKGYLEVKQDCPYSDILLELCP